MIEGKELQLKKSCKRSCKGEKEGKRIDFRLLVGLSFENEHEVAEDGTDM